MKQFSIEIENFHSQFCSSEIFTEDSLDDLHDFYELAFFVKANLQIFIKESKYEINNGDLLFINSNELHHIFYNKTNHYVRYVIHFKKDFIIGILKALNLEDMFDYIERAEYKKISVNMNYLGYLESLFKALKKEEPSFSVQKYALNLVLILTEFYEELKKLQPVGNRSKKALQIMKIVEYIDSNFQNEIDLDFLAKTFYLNKYYISHIFKDVTGFSVMQYIQHRRVVEAQKLLKYTDKDINNICYDCGFNSIQDFYRVFKKVSGTTPLKYRK